MHTESLAHSLRRIATALQSDVDELRKFADQLDNLTDEELKGSALHSNVVLLISRTMNNSSWVSSVESALHSASELVRGRS